MLRRARPDESDLIARLWTDPENANWIEPPEDGEIDAAISDGLAFLWEREAQVQGFAVLMLWVPRVHGLSAIACAKGQGEPFLRALLDEVFGPLQAHRLGFDVTADNHRAIALYHRLGFVTEGRVRECWQRADGAFVDCLLLGMLAREWV